MYHFIYEDKENTVVIRRKLDGHDEIDYVIDMFVQFLLANEFSLDLISEYIKLDGVDED